MGRRLQTAALVQNISAWHVTPRRGRAFVGALHMCMRALPAVRVQTARGALADEDAVLAEFEVVNKIINHLVRKQELLAVASRPTRSPGEDDAAFLARLQEERTLTFHANFVPEV